MLVINKKQNGGKNMKKWQEPKLSDLEMKNTQDGTCPYENEGSSGASTMSLLPVIVWGDGKIGCTYWNSKKHGCEHPNYGKRGMFWPCPQVKPDAVDQS